MILHTEELGFFDMFVKERDGVSLEETLFLGLVGMLGVQLVVEGISLFVELKSFLWVDLFVVELEYVILESGMNVYVCLKIDRGLHSTQTLTWMSLVKIGSIFILWSLFEALKEANTWSLGSWVLVRFRIIILIVMLMLVLAIRCAEKWLANIANRSMRVSLDGLNLCFNFLSLSLLFLLSHTLSVSLDRASVVLVKDCFFHMGKESKF